VAGPSFFFAFLLIYIFSIYFELLPIMSRCLPEGCQTIWQHLERSFLPALSLALPLGGLIFHHLQNMTDRIYPLHQVVSFVLASLLSQLVVVETIFGYPGIGRLLMVAISSVDMPVVAPIVLLMWLVPVVISGLISLNRNETNKKSRQLSIRTHQSTAKAESIRQQSPRNGSSLKPEVQPVLAYLSHGLKPKTVISASSRIVSMENALTQLAHSTRVQTSISKPQSYYSRKNSHPTIGWVILFIIVIFSLVPLVTEADPLWG
jgi:hypothetical protein